MHNAEELAKLKKDALTELCRQYGVSGYSKMKKDEMIAAVTDAEKSAAKKNPAAKEEKPVVKKPAVKKSSAKETKTEKPAAKTAAPAKKAPAAKNSSGKADDGLAAYCAALINLWGIAPIEQVVSAYSRHHDKSITADDVKSLDGKAFVVDGSDLIHTSLAGNSDEINALREKKSKYPFYLPSADEVGKYLDSSFRENSHAFVAMSGYLARTFKIAEDKAGEATRNILGFLNGENGMESVIKSLKALGFKFADAMQFRNFGVLLDNLKGSARLWEFNGHTAAEARNFEEKSGPVRVIKVGRNDPCPCGSGKKYKKCCGR